MPIVPQSSYSNIGAERAVDFEKKLLLKKIAGMTSLPTPSAHVMKVMLLLRDEEVKMGQLIATIGKDQSLVAQILKLVNSGYYGLRKTVDSVERAVNLLGILNIKHLVYSAAIMDLFSDDEQAEWLHSYSASVLMGNIIKENEIEGLANTLPLSTLMHDIGKVVLRRFSPKKYAMALNLSNTDKTPSFRAEEATLHINHAEVGGILLEKWDMDEDIIKPVLYHHNESIPEDYILETALIQFVNWIDCKARNIICFEPSKSLLDAAGIEEIDKNYWIDYQIKLIDTINGTSQPGQTIAHDHKHLSTAHIKRSANAPVAESQKTQQLKISESASQTAIQEKVAKLQSAQSIPTHPTQEAPQLGQEPAVKAQEPDTTVIHRPSVRPKTTQAETDQSTTVLQRPVQTQQAVRPAQPVPTPQQTPLAPPTPPRQEKPQAVTEEARPEEKNESSTETSTRLITKPKSVGMIPPEPQMPAFQKPPPNPAMRYKPAPPPPPPAAPPPAPSPAPAQAPAPAPKQPEMKTEIMSRTLAAKKTSEKNQS